MIIKRACIATVAAVIVLGAPRVLGAHPLHTTLTEVTVDATAHTVRAVVRVFADDFGTALARHVHSASPLTGRAWDDAAVSYLATAVSIADRANHPIALHSCGVRRSADLLWICLEGPTPESARALRARDSILCELFDDQVNIVQAVAGTDKHSVLFTRGDGFRPLW